MEKQYDAEGEIEYFNTVAGTLKMIDRIQIRKCIQILQDAYEREASIYCFGNGGSAATASHMANDFNKGLNSCLTRKFQVFCLNDNIPTLTAIANDIGYDSVFSFQLESKLRSGDVVIAISGSGNSENVLNAVRYAIKCESTVIGFTGFDGGTLKSLSECQMHVPIYDMQVAEDIHMIFSHMLVRKLKDILKPL